MNNKNRRRFTWKCVQNRESFINLSVWSVRVVPLLHALLGLLCCLFDDAYKSSNKIHFFYQAAKLLQDKNAQIELRIHEESFFPELVFGSGSSSQCCGDENARSWDFFWLKPEQTFANFDYTIGI